MKILCPHCGFSKEVDPARLPAGAKRATCPKCKNKFDLPDREPVMASPPPPLKPPAKPKPAAVPPPIEEMPPPMGAMAEEEPGFGPPPVPPEFPEDYTSGRSGIPWEDRPGGFIKDLWSTIAMLLFHPGEFFSKMPVRGGFKAPLTFSILVTMFPLLINVGLLALLFTFFMASMPPEALGPWAPILAAFQLFYLAGLVIILPLLIVVGMFIAAAVYHLFLMIVRGASGGYEATFRAMAYSSGSMFIAVIPGIGFFIASLYSIVLNVMGLARAHQTSAGRVILAIYVIPTCLCTLLPMGVSFLMGILMSVH